MKLRISQMILFKHNSPYWMMHSVICNIYMLFVISTCGIEFYIYLQIWRPLSDLHSCYSCTIRCLTKSSKVWEWRSCWILSGESKECKMASYNSMNSFRSFFVRQSLIRYILFRHPTGFLLGLIGQSKCFFGVGAQIQ